MNAPLHRRTRLALLALILLTLTWAATAFLQAQGTHPVSGRRIASVMGAGGAAWLDRPEREREEEPTKALAALQVSAGQTVADIGAGSGYYTVRLADLVGPTGRVFATDIQPEMLAILRQRLADRKGGAGNIELVQGTPTESRLPDGAVDLALMVDVYHELAQPQVFLRSLKRALKPDGRLVLVEFRKESEWVPIREEHKMSVREARMELEAEGFTFERVIDVLPWQHILIFRPASPR
ncbi:MAG: methyltransferase domain-containing protein [Vicinamibacterales bacterium]